MNGDRILVATSTFSQEGPEPRRELEASGIAFDVNPLGRRLTPEEIVAQGAAATGIVAGVEPYTAEVLAALPRLRVISRVGVGMDSIDRDAAAARGIVIRSTPDAVAQPVAELTLAMIFDLMRHLTTHTTEMRARRWTRTAGGLVAGKTLGIVGLGRIGRRVAELAGVVGMTVVGSDLSPDRDWAARVGVGLTDVPALLAAADVVSLHLAASADAPFVLGEAELEADLWAAARNHLTAAEALEPSRRVYRLLAELETREADDAAAARNWLAKADAAPSDTAWVCRSCGAAHAIWSAVCGNCFAFDTMVWTIPTVAVHLPAADEATAPPRIAAAAAAI